MMRSSGGPPEGPSSSGAILLAIRPRFAELILSGKKKVEFRKVQFLRPVRHVVVYASSPVQRVVGYFEVVGIDVGQPGEFWTRYESVAGVTRDEFDAYYAGAPSGVAIKIGAVAALAESLPLHAFDRSLHPPQSFTYLSTDAFAKVRECCAA